MKQLTTLAALFCILLSSCGSSKDQLKIAVLTDSLSTASNQLMLAKKSMDSMKYLLRLVDLKKVSYEYGADIIAVTDTASYTQYLDLRKKIDSVFKAQKNIYFKNYHSIDDDEKELSEKYNTLLAAVRKTRDYGKLQEILIRDFFSAPTDPSIEVVKDQYQRDWQGKFEVIDSTYSRVINDPVWTSIYNAEKSQVQTAWEILKSKNLAVKK